MICGELKNASILTRSLVSDVGLDIQDDLGRHEVGMVQNINRTPTRDGAGCHFKAHFSINKVYTKKFLFFCPRLQ